MGGVAVASWGRAGVRSAEPGNCRGEGEEDGGGGLLRSGVLGVPGGAVAPSSPCSSLARSARGVAAEPRCGGGVVGAC